MLFVAHFYFLFESTFPLLNAFTLEHQLMLNRIRAIFIYIYDTRPISVSCNYVRFFLHWHFFNAITCDLACTSMLISFVRLEPSKTDKNVCYRYRLWFLNDYQLHRKIFYTYFTHSMRWGLPIEKHLWQRSDTYNTYTKCNKNKTVYSSTSKLTPLL